MTSRPVPISCNAPAIFGGKREYIAVAQGHLAGGDIIGVDLP